MSTLKALRTRIHSIQATQKITTAMKLVSAAKLRRSQERLDSIRAYHTHFQTFWNEIVRAAYFEDLPIWLTQKKSPSKLVIVIMGDRGLCGSYNANMFRFVKHIVESHPHNTIRILPLGYRAIDMLKSHFGSSFVGLLFPSREIKPSLNEMERTVTQFLIKHLQEHDYQSVQICTTHFQSVLHQNITSSELLLDPEPPIVDGYSPFFEPSRKGVLDAAAPLFLEQWVRLSLAEAHTSEYASRMRAMDNATDNARDVLKTLKRSYNRTRQAGITRELIEIVSGANALQAH